MTSIRPWIVVLGALSLFGAIGAAAQSGIQYDIVQDEYGNVIGQVPGNGVSIDMDGVAATDWSVVTCVNNGTPTMATGCPGGAAPLSVYISKTKVTPTTMPSLAARTPPAASKCSAGWWAVYLNGGWTCKLRTKTGVVKTRINQ